MSDYQPRAIESKWQKYWEENKTFRTRDMPEVKKFYCLDMFPYPSGSGLHIGHPLGYTATDIYSRYKRMQGFDVLHPMGYDAFGLPAEQHAVATGEHPGVITRKNCEIFTAQMKTIGLGYDWDREVRTCDADYYQWTQWIFLKLYNAWFDDKQQKARPIEELKIPEEIRRKGEKAIHDFQAEHRLAYYADAMVNWCAALGTVLANEEVIDGKSERGGHDVIRKPMKQWMLRITKYAERLLSELDILDWPEAIKEQQRNWIGRRFGARIHFPVSGGSASGSESVLTAFTTRPDTLFGVTFFVISPEHPILDSGIVTGEWRTKIAKYRDEAKKLSEFARSMENRKKTGVFTGAFVVNPATGEEVPLYCGDYVLMGYGTGAVMGVPAHDERDFEFARLFQIPIRPVIVPESASHEVQEAVKEGEMAWTEEGVMLEGDFPVLQELQIIGKANTLANEAILNWLEKSKNGERIVNYKLRDWLFSRQRYWGEPIPIVHWEDGRRTALNEEELPLRLPEVEDYKPSESGESPLSKASDWLQVQDPTTGLRGVRETNTMPQWAGSCWYYLRFIDPKNSKALCDGAKEKAWMNVDLYVGGAEHAVLHLLYSRFWHKVLYDLGVVSTKEPFQKLFNQGMILAHAYRDERGALVPIDQVQEIDNGKSIRVSDGQELEKIIAKMSKSLRNVINPDDVIGQYGADTLRTYLMFIGPLDQARPWDSNAISGSHRFIRRAWSWVMERELGEKTYEEEVQESEEVRRALHTAIKKVTESLETLRFNTAVSSLMECLNELYGAAVSKSTVERFVLLLSPIAPHIAEELWSKLGHAQSLAYEPWPKFNAACIEVSTVTVVVQVQGKKRATLEVHKEIAEDELKNSVIAAMKGSSYEVLASDKFFTVRNKENGAPKLVNVVR